MSQSFYTFHLDVHGWNVLRFNLNCLQDLPILPPQPSSPSMSIPTLPHRPHRCQTRTRRPSAESAAPATALAEQLVAAVRADSEEAAAEEVAALLACGVALEQGDRDGQLPLPLGFEGR